MHGAVDENPVRQTLAALRRAGLELLHRSRRTYCPPREDPLDGARAAASPAGSRPDGERRTTPPGRPGGLRMTTQRFVGGPKAGSSPSRPRRCPPGVATGCRDGAAPSARSPVPDPSGTRGRRSGKGPSDAYSEGPFLVRGDGCPQACPLVHRAASPEWPSRPPHRAICPVQSTGVVPSLCTGSRAERDRRARPVDAVCTPGGRRPETAQGLGTAAGSDDAPGSASRGCRSTDTSGRAPPPSVKMTPRSGGTSP